MEIKGSQGNMNMFMVAIIIFVNYIDSATYAKSHDLHSDIDQILIALCHKNILSSLKVIYSLESIADNAFIFDEFSIDCC